MSYSSSVVSRYYVIVLDEYMLNLVGKPFEKYLLSLSIVFCRWWIFADVKYNFKVEKSISTSVVFISYADIAEILLMEYFRCSIHFPYRFLFLRSIPFSNETKTNHSKTMKFKINDNFGFRKFEENCCIKR